MDFRFAVALRVSRTHYFIGFQPMKPLFTLGAERVLTEPRGFGLYIEWA